MVNILFRVQRYEEASTIQNKKRLFFCFYCVARMFIDVVGARLTMKNEERKWENQAVRTTDFFACFAKNGCRSCKKIFT